MQQNFGRKLIVLASALILLCACASAKADAQEARPTPAACPDVLTSIAHCYSGRDINGAYYWIAIPTDWNHHLIVHAHGGPHLGDPQPNASVEDLTRFAVMVQNHYAWAGTSYRRGGFGVRLAAADIDHLRALFWNVFGRPERTILHGQSWGGNVAARASELYALAPDGSKSFDGVLLTSGVIAGGTRAYTFRADLRAVYQYYCRNHPLPSEPAYPLWEGLPHGAHMTRAALEARVNSCTGVNLPASQRSAEQTQRLQNITRVIGIDEQSLVSHLAWATFEFRDLVHNLGDRNPFDNSTTRYIGSTDDNALNAGVARFHADPRAVHDLAYDADMTGQISVPTLTIHALHDPTAAFAMEALYAQTVARAGRSSLLVQTATDEAVHSKLSEAEYVALLRTLEHWIDTGQRPDQVAVASACQALAGSTPGGCHFAAPPPPD